MWFANAFSYYGLVLLTTEMFQIGNACEGYKYLEFKNVQFKNVIFFDLLASGSPGHAKVENCFLKCLTRNDYIDLLYTTLAEFPGYLE
jgi:hypothetical protein